MLPVATLLPPEEAVYHLTVLDAVAVKLMLLPLQIVVELIEDAVIADIDNVVIVALLLPATPGSSLKTVVKLLPLTDAWLDMLQELGVLLIVALKVIVVLVPKGNVKPLPAPFTVTVSPEVVRYVSSPSVFSSLLLFSTGSFVF